MLVHNINECGFACVKIYFCLSFNIAIRADIHGHLLCKVLANDKYNEASKFLASEDFHHYSIVVSKAIHTANMFAICRVECD